MNPIDITGKRYGNLVVLRLGETQTTPSGQKKRRWVCQCDCGNITLAYQQKLVQGLKTSCGCKTVEKS